MAAGARRADGGPSGGPLQGTGHVHQVGAEDGGLDQPERGGGQGQGAVDVAQQRVQAHRHADVEGDHQHVGDDAGAEQAGRAGDVGGGGGSVAGDDQAHPDDELGEDAGGDDAQVGDAGQAGGALGVEGCRVHGVLLGAGPKPRSVRDLQRMLST